jgi:hypothetical protein
VRVFQIPEIGKDILKGKHTWRFGKAVSVNTVCLMVVCKQEMIKSKLKERN